jgi:hypothetical protein
LIVDGLFVVSQIFHSIVIVVPLHVSKFFRIEPLSQSILGLTPGQAIMIARQTNLEAFGRIGKF